MTDGTNPTPRIYSTDWEAYLDALQAAQSGNVSNGSPLQWQVSDETRYTLVPEDLRPAPEQPTLLTSRPHPVRLYESFGPPDGPRFGLRLKPRETLSTHDTQEETPAQVLARIKARIDAAIADGPISVADRERLFPLAEKMAVGELGLYLLRHGGLDGHFSDYRFNPEVLARAPNETDLDHEILHRLPLNVGTLKRFEVFNRVLTKTIRRGGSRTALTDGRKDQLDVLTVIDVPSGYARGIIGVGARHPPEADQPQAGATSVQGIQFLAIDRDAASLAGASQLARSQGVPLRTLWRDAFKLNMHEEADVLTSHGLTPYLNDDEVLRFYRQCYRALKIGGSFVVSQITPHHEWNDISNDDLSLQIDIYQHLARIRFSFHRTKEQTIELLVRAGFSKDDIQVHDEGHGMFPTFEATKKSPETRFSSWLDSAVVSSDGTRSVHASFKARYEWHKVENKDRYVLTNSGIHTWDDLADYIHTALQANPSIYEFVIDAYQMDFFEPPQSFWKEMLHAVEQHPNKQVVLVIKGNTLEPPRVIQWHRGFLGDGKLVQSGLNLSRIDNTIFTHDSLRHEADPASASFWKSDRVRGVIEGYLIDHPEMKKLYEAMRDIHADIVGAPLAAPTHLGKYLTRILERARPDLVESDQRTHIIPLIYQLQKDLVALIKSEQRKLNQGRPLPAAYAYYDPVSCWLRAHPADRSSENQAVSIGGGAMNARWAHQRRLMDCGYDAQQETGLQLDFGMTTFTSADELVWEMRELGTNRVANFYETTPLNPQGENAGRDIDYLPNRMRNGYLRRYRPNIIFLNQKAKELVELFKDEEFLSLFDLKGKPSETGVSKPYCPVLVMPAKAFDGAGSIPYLEIYCDLVRRGKKELADRILVEGGFFNAKDMLSGRKTYMTIAGGSAEALEEYRKLMSPHRMNNGRADWEVMEIEFIQSVEVAALLMGGGAGKNYEIYGLASEFQDRILDLSDIDYTNPAVLSRLEAELVKATNDILPAIEEDMARLFTHYNLGFSADHLRSPKGLFRDVENCAPPHLVELGEIRDEWKILAAMGECDKFHAGLTKLVRRIEKGRDPDGLHDGLGDGTRNARDGYIDSVLWKAFSHARSQQWIEEGVSFDEFRDGIKAWTGKEAQEGRNAIEPLIALADQNRIPLHPLTYKAWNYYHRGSTKKPYSEPIRSDRPLTADDALLWGLDKGFLKKMAHFVIAQSSNVDEWLTHYELGNRPEYSIQKFLFVGLNQLHGALETFNAQTGYYPEVDRLFKVMQERVAALCELLGPTRNHEEEHLVFAIRRFAKMLHKAKLMFTSPPHSTKILIVKMREVTKRLFDVELTLDQELRKKQGRNGNGRASDPNASMEQVISGSSLARRLGDSAAEGGNRVQTLVAAGAQGHQQDSSGQHRASLNGILAGDSVSPTGEAYDLRAQYEFRSNPIPVRAQHPPEADQPQAGAAPLRGQFRTPHRAPLQNYRFSMRPPPFSLRGPSSFRPTRPFFRPL